MIWRIHKNSTVFRIQSVIYAVHYNLTLLFICNLADYSPALWVKPHIRLCICTLADNISFFCKSSYKTILVIADFLNNLSEFFLLFVKLFYIVIIIFIFSKLSKYCHCIIILHCNKRRFSVFSKS